MNFNHVILWANGPWTMKGCRFIAEASCKSCNRQSVSDIIEAKPMRILSVRCRECNEISAKIHVENYQIYSESIYEDNLKLVKILVE